MKTFTEIPEGLANIAKGRDRLPTDEFAYVTNTATQTIRKHLCQKGHFHGVVPIKIGSRLQFAVEDIARLLRGESL